MSYNTFTLLVEIFIRAAKAWMFCTWHVVLCQKNTIDCIFINASEHLFFFYLP